MKKNRLPSYLVKNLNTIASKVFGYSSQHACAIFKRGRIISTGTNRMSKRPLLRRLKYRNCWIHAEADAVLKASRTDLTGATVLVIRTGKTKLKNSKPCSACLALLAENGIEDIFYSTREGTIENLKDRRQG